MSHFDGNLKGGAKQSSRVRVWESKANVATVSTAVSLALPRALSCACLNGTVSICSGDRRAFFWLFYSQRPDPLEQEKFFA